MTARAKQGEKSVRVDVVARALLADMPLLAGIFSESHLEVLPGQIVVHWRFCALNPAEQRQMERDLSAMLDKLGIRYRVTLEVRRG